MTDLPRVPLPVAIATSTLLMICMSSRFVPAMAMMTASVEARYRGGFMSIIRCATTLDGIRLVCDRADTRPE